jgi:hypothetical protein
MKKIILLASLAFSLNAFSQIPSYVSTTGLVGWWPFTSNANDQSVNGLNGTVNGAVLTLDRFGNANSAYSFNGSNQKITVTDNSLLSFTNSIFSYSYWANINSSITNGSSILCKYNITSDFEYAAFTYTSGAMSFSTYNLGGTCGPQGCGISSSVPLQNNWHHFVFVADGSSGSKLYVDNTLVQSNPYNASCLMGNGAGNLYFGMGGGWNQQLYFNGKIDDIGIWNRALTPCEITQLYNASVFNTPTITAASSTTLCSGNTTTLSTSTVGSYTWSNGANTQSITVSAVGLYSVAVTNGACTGNSSPLLITVNPSPTVTVNNGTICSGKSFTIVPSGANTYTYSSGSAIVSPTTNTNYNVIGTSSLGCISSNTAVSSVSVNPNPTVTSVSNTSLICVGESATLTANGANAYTWNPGALTSSNIVISPTITTNYTVVGTNTLTGCTNQTTLTQSVSACTGIVNLSSSDNLVNAYPNPTKGLVTIELTTNSKVYMTNALGQLVYNEVLSAGKHYIDIKNQSNGIYFMKVLQQDKQQTIKLIKE